jgi:Ca-activated chloride channel family protein
MSNRIQLRASAFLFFFSLLIELNRGGLAQTNSSNKDYKLTVEVNLVTVTVTVTKADGSWVPDLTEQDFQIFEDDQNQKISFFSRQSDQPLQLFLLFDSSFSIAPELKTQQDAAIEFIKTTLRPVDRVSVLRISEEVDEVVHNANQMERIIEAIRSVKPGGGTSLYDAIYLASDILKESKGRRVILVISDGTDTTSRTHFQDCLKKALNSESVIYSLIVQPIKSEPGRNLGGEHALIYFSERTGGRYFLISYSYHLRESFETISKELRTQYVLGYYPQSSFKRDYHKIEVRVSNPTYVVRARDGYFHSLR